MLKSCEESKNADSEALRRDRLKAKVRSKPQFLIFYNHLLKLIKSSRFQMNFCLRGFQFICIFRF